MKPLKNAFGGLGFVDILETSLSLTASDSNVEDFLAFCDHEAEANTTELKLAEIPNETIKKLRSLLISPERSEDSLNDKVTVNLRLAECEERLQIAAEVGQELLMQRQELAEHCKKLSSKLQEAYRISRTLAQERSALKASLKTACRHLRYLEEAHENHEKCGIDTDIYEPETPTPASGPKNTEGSFSLPGLKNAASSENLRSRVSSAKSSTSSLSSGTGGGSSDLMLARQLEQAYKANENLKHENGELEFQVKSARLSLYELKSKNIAQAQQIVQLEEHERELLDTVDNLRLRVTEIERQRERQAASNKAREGEPVDGLESSAMQILRLEEERKLMREAIFELTNEKEDLKDEVMSLRHQQQHHHQEQLHRFHRLSRKSDDFGAALGQAGLNLSQELLQLSLATSDALEVTATTLNVGRAAGHVVLQPTQSKNSVRKSEFLDRETSDDDLPHGMGMSLAEQLLHADWPEGSGLAAQTDIMPIVTPARKSMTLLEQMEQELSENIVEKTFHTPKDAEISLKQTPAAAVFVNNNSCKNLQTPRHDVVVEDKQPAEITRKESALQFQISQQLAGLMPVSSGSCRFGSSGGNVSSVGGVAGTSAANTVSSSSSSSSSTASLPVDEDGLYATEVEFLKTKVSVLRRQIDATDPMSLSRAMRQTFDMDEVCTLSNRMLRRIQRKVHRQAQSRSNTQSSLSHSPSPSPAPTPMLAPVPILSFSAESSGVLAELAATGEKDQVLAVPGLSSSGSELWELITQLVDDITFLRILVNEISSEYVRQVQAKAKAVVRPALSSSAKPQRTRGGSQVFLPRAAETSVPSNPSSAASSGSAPASHFTSSRWWIFGAGSWLGGEK